MQRPQLSRREVVVFGSAALGSALFSARRAAAAAEANTPAQAADPIWGTNGAATAIIRSLQHLTQASFPAVDFPVTRYGARQCRVV
jgi:uncharacterized protein (DUF1501 family)